jgi:hypothetical protein
MVGVDVKWNFLKHFSLYGTLMLDEFLLEEVTGGNGWWANKYGLQAGIKYIDVMGISNLDLTLEYNESRPYTYAHIDVFRNYAHYRQPLAHPYGANFREILGVIHFQPIGRLTFTGKVIYADYGEDDSSTNWGKNVMYSYTTRESDYGNYIGQGYNTDLLYLDLLTTYQLRHNVFFDLSLLYREEISQLEILNEKTNHVSLGFRWNIPKRDQDF